MEITQLRKRAAAIGCRVRVFRKDYTSNGKRVRYGFVDSIGEQLVPSVVELRTLVRRHERIFAEHGTPNVSLKQARS